MTGVSREFTDEEIKTFSDLFYYDETSPTGISRKKNVYGGKKMTTLCGKAGEPAGSFKSQKNGRRRCVHVRANGRMYLAHRIIYTLEIGKIPPGYDIDHIDKNPWNNNINNLRVVKRTINSRNLNMSRGNTSGISGIGCYVLENKYTVFVATLGFNKKKYRKVFYVNKHGLLPAFKMAIEWRRNKIQEFNEKFNAGYSLLHGEKFDEQ